MLAGDLVVLSDLLSAPQEVPGTLEIPSVGKVNEETDWEGKCLGSGLEASSLR